MWTSRRKVSLIGGFLSPGAGALGLVRMAWVMAACLACVASETEPRTVVRASSTSPASTPAGAFDGDRFGLADADLWRGGPAPEGRWWWEVQFPGPRRVGCILQIVGDHDFVFTNAPTAYVWQGTADGERWIDLEETRQIGDRRLYRLHRLRSERRLLGLRMAVARAEGLAPVLREVEVFASRREKVPFPDWIVAVNTTHVPELPGHGQEFIPLARSCDGGVDMPAQQVWLDTFAPAFLEVEPRPLAAFLSGNFKDWCEVDRSLWRGVEQVVRSGRTPLWGSCGGAQGMAIVAETGVDRVWDCPHCRDPSAPRLPIYTHIGHRPGSQPRCGDYSACVHERGPQWVTRVMADPVFDGLPESFQVMESHCGQIEWPPAGWTLVATAGAGALTRTQCLRVEGRPVYAAQFHIEMDGTPEASRRIMANFLRLARAWRDR